MLERILLILGIELLALAKPGQTFALILRNALTYGKKAGVLTAIGAVFGNLTHMVLCAAGLGLVLTNNPLIFKAVLVIGSLFLFYLGVNSIRSAFSIDGNSKSAGADKTEAVDSFRALSIGYLCNLLHPFGTIYYLSLFTQVIDPGSSGRELIIYVIALTCLGFLYWVGFALLVQMKIIQERIRRAERSINFILGSVLVLLALSTLSFNLL